MHIQNKTFVVTGAGGGIGGEIVLELLKRGGKVIALDLREEGLKTIQQRANQHSEVLRAQTLDITERTAVERFVAQLAADNTGIDGLINCAGIIQPFEKVENLEIEAMERVMNVNFWGTVYITKAVLPELLKRNESHIVNVSSMGGFLPVPGQSVYGASKAAVKLMTEGLYAELLDTPVRVSVAFPGATETDITKNSDVAFPTGANSEASSYKMLSAGESARIIVDGIEKNKLYIYTGSDSKAMSLLYRLHPGFATRFIAKKMKSLLG